jgi:hypothetical protein
VLLAFTGAGQDTITGSLVVVSRGIKFNRPFVRLSQDVLGCGQLCLLTNTKSIQSLSKFPCVVPILAGTSVSTGMLGAVCHSSASKASFEKYQGQYGQSIQQGDYAARCQLASPRKIFLCCAAFVAMLPIRQTDEAAPSMSIKVFFRAV